ncbi:unnamed protein product [Diamesa serratosioi]
MVKLQHKTQKNEKFVKNKKSKNTKPQKEVKGKPNAIKETPVGSVKVPKVTKDLPVVSVKAPKADRFKGKPKTIKAAPVVAVKITKETKVSPVVQEKTSKVDRVKNDKKPTVQDKLPGINNFWNVDTKSIKRPAADEEDSDENDSNDVKKLKLSGAERYQKYVDEEDRIRKIEEELADPNLVPHTPDQFERALLKDRNSSFLWISYMAFHLETAETEKARGVAKKAISTMNFREENELLNVWVALMNLELRYGTEDTYNETLQEAVQRTDPFKLYSKTLIILLELGKNEEIEKIIEILLKKFKPMPEMWLAVCEAYLKLKTDGKAKQLLPKSLLSLEDKDHVDFMIKFALLNNRYAQTDFAQVIFEKILTTYNKKLPIWFTYIDMLIKNKEIEVARQTFERVLTVSFPIKKLKTIFQKYIDFETKHGEAANISKIKKTAKTMLEKE